MSDKDKPDEVEHAWENSYEVSRKHNKEAVLPEKFEDRWDIFECIQDIQPDAIRWREMWEKGEMSFEDLVDNIAYAGFMNALDEVRLLCVAFEELHPPKGMEDMSGVLYPRKYMKPAIK